MMSERLSIQPDEVPADPDKDTVEVDENSELNTSPSVDTDKQIGTAPDTVTSATETAVEKEEDPEDRKLRTEMQFKVYLLRITGIQRIGIDKYLSREAEEPDHEAYKFSNDLLDLMDDMLGDKQTNHDQLMNIKKALDIIGGEVTDDEELEIHRQYEVLGDEKKIKPLILPGVKDLRTVAAHKLLDGYRETTPQLDARIQHASRPMDRKNYPYYTRNS